MTKSRDSETNSETRRFLKNRDTWIREVVGCPDLTAHSARVGVHLAMRMSGENQMSWPATKTIAKECAMSVRSVIRAIDQLEEEGWIFAERKRNVGNKYALRMPWQ